MLQSGSVDPMQLVSLEISLRSEAMSWLNEFLEVDGLAALLDLVVELETSETRCALVALP